MKEKYNVQLAVRVSRRQKKKVVKASKESDHNETIDAVKVLDELQNLKSNPKLLDYVIKCLNNQEIATVPDKFYCVVVNAELRMPYNEKIHGTFEKYKQFCVDGDYGLKKQDKLLSKVFNGIAEIEDYAIENEGEEIIGFGNTKFQRYSIHEIGGN